MGDEISTSNDVNVILSTSPPIVNIATPHPAHVGHSSMHHHTLQHNFLHEPNIASIMKDINNSANNSATTSANTSPSLTSLPASNFSPNFGNFNLNFTLNDTPNLNTSTNINNNSSSNINNNNNNINNNNNKNNNNNIAPTIPDNIEIISPPATSSQIPDVSGYLSCHTSVCLDDKIVIFGGLYKKEKRDDVIVYNIAESQWESPKVKGPTPSARYCHTACLYKPINPTLQRPPSNSNINSIHFSSPKLKNVSSNSTKINSATMVVFGGLAHIRLNDVHLLDFDSMAWSTVSPAGMLPLERSHHSAVLFGHHMVIFGGLADTGQRLNDVHILDLEAMCWVQPLVSGTNPPPRLAHSAEVYSNRMVVFGGYDGKIRMNDVFVLDFGTMRWSQPLLQGPPPVPRFGETMTLVGTKVVIFGGSTGVHNALTNDHFVVLDLETLVWSEIRPTGPTPPPLHYHTAIIHNNKIWYYGGVKKFNGFILLDLDTIEILKNRDFCEARDFVNNTLNEALENLDMVFQTESLRGGATDGIISVTATIKNVNQSAKTIFAEMRRQLNLLTEAEVISKEKLKQQKEGLEHAKAVFEAHKQRMEEINKRQQTRVKLNIGGSRYETSVATLAKDGESMLSAMFSGLYHLSPDPDDGSIFIDRDGTHFRYILNYLRDGTFQPPREVSILHELLQEAEYYQISGLIQILKEHLQPHDIEI